MYLTITSEEILVILANVTSICGLSVHIVSSLWPGHVLAKYCQRSLIRLLLWQCPSNIELTKCFPHTFPVASEASWLHHMGYGSITPTLWERVIDIPPDELEILNLKNIYLTEYIFAQSTITVNIHLFSVSWPTLFTFVRTNTLVKLTLFSLIRNHVSKRHDSFSQQNNLNKNSISEIFRPKACQTANITQLNPVFTDFGACKYTHHSQKCYHA